MHPKTLILSILKPSSKDDPAPDFFNTMTEEIYDMGTHDTPLHLKIDMWRKDKQRHENKLTLKLSQLKCLFMPRQKFLNQIDPNQGPMVNWRSLLCV